MYICIAYLYIDKYQLYMCWLVHTIPLRPSFGRSNANDQKTRCVFFSAQELTVSEKLRSKFLGRNLVNSLCVESFHDFRVLSSNKFWSSIVQKTTILTYSTKEYIYIRIEREIQYDFKTHDIDLTTKQLIFWLSCLRFTHGKKTPKLSKTRETDALGVVALLF
jgi:hypothetical protein